MIRTTESVCEGHPDKIADQIADAVLDAYLADDPASRVGCEVMVNSAGTVIVAGEVTSSAVIDIERIVYGIHPSCQRVLIDLQQQYPALSATVAAGGANDQGIVVGYACIETPELMPLPIILAHRLTRRLAEVRKDETLPYLRADGKAQITLDGDRLAVVVISTQHDSEVSIEALRAGVQKHVLSVVPITADTRVFINAQSDRFEDSGDTGVTGRKIISDTYGAQLPHGGGAFSGKDPSKIDRSGAYISRHIAKSAVARGMATRCLIELGYCIGVPEPVSINVESDGDTEAITKFIKTFPLSTAGIIDYLNLRRPIYRATATYGHFGRPEFPWENVA